MVRTNGYVEKKMLASLSFSGKIIGFAVNVTRVTVPRRMRIKSNAFIDSSFNLWPPTTHYYTLYHRLTRATGILKTTMYLTSSTRCDCKKII